MIDGIHHVPIMVQEVVSHVPAETHIYVDGTAGHGGHMSAIAAHGVLAKDAHIIAIDRDAIMLKKAQKNNKDIPYAATYIQDTYAHISSILQKLGPDVLADFVFLDIGVNMEHFKDGQRGFSVHEKGPLDMRFDTKKGKTAADLLNMGTREERENAFIHYGDFAPKSATFFYEGIEEQRKKEAFTTTDGLVTFLYSIGVRKNQLPPFFQCIRILVNQELTQLETFLQTIPAILSSKGRCAIMTFHSIEDRLVKYAFKALVETGEYALVTKKPISPHYTEVQKNRAARSAKLRIIEKKA